MEKEGKKQSLSWGNSLGVPQKKNQLKNGKRKDSPLVKGLAIRFGKPWPFKSIVVT